MKWKCNDVLRCEECGDTYTEDDHGSFEDVMLKRCSFCRLCKPYMDVEKISKELKQALKNKDIQEIARGRKIVIN